MRRHLPRLALAVAVGLIVALPSGAVVLGKALAPSPSRVDIQTAYSSQIISQAEGLVADCELRVNESGWANVQSYPQAGDIGITECRIRSVADPQWMGSGEPRDLPAPSTPIETGKGPSA